MKTLNLLFIFLAAFMGGFFTLSLIAILWTSYGNALTNVNWFIVYAFIFGWEIGLLPAMEYHKKNEAYFNEVFN
jgi:hypothetical protein